MEKGENDNIENKEIICKYCGKKFYVNIHSHSHPKYCSDECRKNNNEKCLRTFNLQYRNAVTNTLNEQSIEGIDYVECPICHEKHAQINLTHFKRHGYTSREQIFNDFPNLQMTCKKVINTNLIGENNPMSKHNRSELERKQASPYSIEHYLKKYGGNADLATKKLQEFLNNIDRSSWLENTRINYYVAKGLSDDDAKKALKQRQVTNGLDHYIKKYGKIIGEQKYQERMESWCKNTFTGKSHSHIADICISEIIEDHVENMYFGKNEFVCKSPNSNNNYKIDLTNSKNNRMIEFFGDYWHCNPKIYNENYIRGSKKILAKDIWKRDQIRIKDLNDLGYNIMIIWEYDYIHNHDDIIKKAKQFIFGYE